MSFRILLAVTFAVVAAVAAGAYPIAPEISKDEARAMLGTLQGFVQNHAALKGANADEAVYAAVEKDVLIPWRAAWTSRDGAAFGALFAAGGRGLNWGAARLKPVRERDGIREYGWRLEPAGDAGAQAAAYLNGFDKVEHVSLLGTRIVPAGDRARLSIRYDVRGLAADGSRRHDRGDLQVALARGESGWRIQDMSPAALERLEARAAVFRDETDAWGLAAVPVIDRREAIRRGGYAMAVSDYDGDRRPDILVGSYGPMQLWRNAGDHYENVTEAAGLRGETLVKSAAFADLDNDGRRDIVLLRFVPDGSKEGDFVAYRNIGDGKFALKGDVLTRSRRYDRSMPLALADFDGDGAIDLYLGFPGSWDFTNLGKPAKKLAPQGVWLNDGTWNFAEVPQKSGIFEEDDSQLFPHHVFARDFNGDRRADVMVIDDRGNASPIYRNDGNGYFTDVTDAAGIEHHSWGMGALAGDYNGDGKPDLVLTSIDFTAAQRILASRQGRAESVEEHAALSAVKDTLNGIRLFENRGDGTFKESTIGSGLAWAGEAPAGAQWVDYNNDGWLDLYVSNGLWTGGKHDVSSLFARLHLARFTSEEAASAVETVMDMPTAMPFTDAPNPFLQLLRAFRGDPENPGADVDRGALTLSMGGGERNRMYRNNGDGTFTEVGYLTNSDSLEDGYVAAWADIDLDGRQDLVLRNCDPAPGRRARSLNLLRNVGASGHSLTVFLEGKDANRDGVGASLTAWINGRRLERTVQSVTGAVQSELSAFFGLGSAEAVDKLEVRWDTGRTETFGPVKGGRVLIREGEGSLSVVRR